MNIIDPIKYLNRLAKMSLAKDDIYIFLNNTDIKLTKEQFKVKVNQIFGNTDDFINIFETWYQNELVRFNQEFDEFLQNCRVVLTDRNWVVIHSEIGEINDEAFIRKSANFNLNLSKNFENWVENAIIDASTKMFNY